MRECKRLTRALVVLAVASLGSAQGAGPEISNREARADEWGYRPADGQVVRLNPPSLTWIHEKEAASYSVEWSARSDFSGAERVERVLWPTYTHDEVMKPGTYYWRYRYQTAKGEESSWSQARRFTIPEGAVAFAMPTRAQQRERIPRGHPRLFLVEEDLIKIREAAKKGEAAQAFGRLKEEADRVLKAGPTPEPEHMGSARDKENPELVKYWWPNRQQTEKACGEAELLAFVALVTGEEAYREGARKWVLDLAAWDPDGPTNFRLNCEAAKPLLYRLPRAYDWAHDVFTEPEREVIRRAISRRIKDAWESSEVERGVGHLSRPYVSHGNRVWHKIGEAGIATLGEIPEAATWVDYAVNKFYACYPVWSDDDGGWHEGVSYWAGYMSKAVWWLQVSKKAIQIDGLRKPFFSQVGDFPLYVAPPGSPNAGFGDLSYRPPSSGVGSFLNYFIRASGDLADGGHAAYWRWWAEKWGMEDRGGVLGFLDLTNLPEPPAAKAPTDLPESKVFHGIGVASLHTTLLDSRQDVHLLFKSSPFGSQSHGHNPQNSFQLNAYGEPLIVACVFRDLHGSKFHYQWVHSTMAQNAVLVDGQGQKKHSTESQGRIVSEQLTPDWDYVVGDATAAYEDRLERYRRHVILLKSPKLSAPLVVLYDELRARKPSTYQFMLHAFQPFEINAGSGELVVRRPRAQARVKYLAADGEVGFRQWDGYDPKPSQEFPNMWHAEASVDSPRQALDMITVIVPEKAGKVLAWDSKRLESEDCVGTELMVEGVKATVVFRKGDTQGAAEWRGQRFEGPVLIRCGE